MTTRIFDCHSHLGTKRGYIFRTPEELARQEAVWRTPVHYYTEDEMIQYMRDANARTIFDLSIAKFLPMEEVRDLHDYTLELQAKNRDVVFGQWLQFDPRRGAESIKEFERCVSKNS